MTIDKNCMRNFKKSFEEDQELSKRIDKELQKLNETNVEFKGFEVYGSLQSSSCGFLRWCWFDRLQMSERHSAYGRA